MITWPSIFPVVSENKTFGLGMGGEEKLCLFYSRHNAAVNWKFLSSMELDNIEAYGDDAKA